MNTNLQPPGAAVRILKPRFQVPVMRGVIDRRMLVNFRCDPAVIRPILPAPFRPKLVRGSAMAGICLIRLKELRPRWLSAPLGFTSENAAHRIAVEWELNGEQHEGVFIPRRDTNARLNVIAGGRLFPGVHHLARFTVWESPNRFKVEMHSDDGSVRARLAARVFVNWPTGSIFSTLEEASAFFASGSLGWSAGNRPDEFDGLELRSFDWHVEPLMVERVESSFFDDPLAFPPGSVAFDSALLMRGIEHEWHGRGRMLCSHDL